MTQAKMYINLDSIDKKASTPLSGETFKKDRLSLNYAIGLGKSFKNVKFMFKKTNSAQSPSP